MVGQGSPCKSSEMSVAIGGEQVKQLFPETIQVGKDFYPCNNSGWFHRKDFDPCKIQVDPLWRILSLKISDPQEALTGALGATALFHSGPLMFDVV